MPTQIINDGPFESLTVPTLNEGDDLGTLSSFDMVGIDRFRPKAVVAGQTAWKDLFVYLASDSHLEIDPQSLGEVRDGSMSWVIQATQPTYGNRLVALKVCKFPVHTAQGALFREEVATTARLKHPGIPDILGQGTLEDGDLPYLVMHYIHGQTLEDLVSSWAHDREVVNRAGSSPLEARRWRSGDRAPALAALAEAADTLGYAHSHGVVHRDVKPSNIMLSSAGRSFVLDFGLQSTPSNAFPSAGTPRYAAPEQFDSSFGPISPRTDVWGLGACLLEMMSGQKTGTLSEIAQSIRVCREIRPSLPPELLGILRKCLSHNPEARYSTAQDFARDIRNFLKGFPVAGYLEECSSSERQGYLLRRFVARNASEAGGFLVRHKAASTVVALSLLGCGGALYAWEQFASERREREASVVRLDGRREELLKRATEKLINSQRLAARDEAAESVRSISPEFLAELREHREDPRIESVAVQIDKHRLDYEAYLKAEERVYSAYGLIANSPDFSDTRSIAICLPQLREAVSPFFPDGQLTPEGLASFKSWLDNSALHPRHRVKIGDRLLEAFSIIEYVQHRTVYEISKEVESPKETRAAFEQRLALLAALSLATSDPAVSMLPFSGVRGLRVRLFHAVKDSEAGYEEERRRLQEGSRASGHFLMGLLQRETAWSQKQRSGARVIAFPKDISGFQATLASDPRHVGALACITDIHAATLRDIPASSDPRPTLRLLIETSRNLARLRPEDPQLQLRVAHSTWSLWKAERQRRLQDRGLTDGNPAVILEVTRALELCAEKKIAAPFFAYLARGESYSLTNNQSAAITDLTKCWELDGGNPAPKVRLGLILLQAKKPYSSVPGFTEKEFKTALGETFEDPDVVVDATVAYCELALREPENHDVYCEAAFVRVKELMARNSDYKELILRFTSRGTLFAPLNSYPPFQQYRKLLDTK